MRLFVYEGTPEEIRQVAADLSPPLPQLEDEPRRVAAPRSAKSSAKEDTKETAFVSVKVARRVLSRRRMSPEQNEVLQALYKAYPARVAAPDLQELINYTPGQFAGLMGAFGRRLTHTSGYVDGSWFFDQEWDYEAKFNRYGLPDTVREAMELEKLV